jgi:aminopeptidase
MAIDSDYVRPLADLTVRFGASVQPGQIVAISAEPGKEPLARAIADAAYKQGAKFVDPNVFDVHVKHARLEHASPDTLEYVPPWYGDRMRAYGEHRAATIALTGDGREVSLLRGGAWQV